MKIAVINGQNHKGSTYHIGKQVADKLGGEVTEFFLPRDFGDFCVGCTQCFLKSETLCPHYERLKKITEAIWTRLMYSSSQRPCMFIIAQAQ